MLLAAGLLIYVCVAAALYITDVGRPHSQSFSHRQHRDNYLVGALLWPLGAVLLLVACMIPSYRARSMDEEAWWRS